MNLILIPENVNPFNKQEVFAFMDTLGLSMKDDPEEIFQYLDEFTQQQFLDMGQRVFLRTNTYDKYPGQKFVVGYEVDFVKSKIPVKTYIVHEYKCL